MMDGLFSQSLMDNSFRGIWCEYMVAEALGPECRTVGAGWHAWDLQIGDSKQDFPERIRIQVKNSARLQSWNAATGKESQCEFHLKLRNRPYYFEQYNAGVPCEVFGFLCDVYVLCWHNEVGPRADHRDPFLWKFFIVPVVGPNTGVADKELDGALKKGSEWQVSRPNAAPTDARGRDKRPLAYTTH